MNEKHSFDIAYGLAFNIERANTKSGFQPRGSGDFEDNYYFDLRLRGFAAMLELGFCKKLYITGAEEKIDEGKSINRAYAITQMLISDFGVPKEQVEHLDSTASTDGNLISIAEHIKQSQHRSVIVTNNYHIPRSLLFARGHGISSPLYPAEAFLLATGRITVGDLEKVFGDNPYAKRCAAGIKGISDLVLGQYSSENKS